MAGRPRRSEVTPRRRRCCVKLETEMNPAPRTWRLRALPARKPLTRPPPHGARLMVAPHGQAQGRRGPWVPTPSSPIYVTPRSKETLAAGLPAPNHQTSPTTPPEFHRTSASTTSLPGDAEDVSPDAVSNSSTSTPTTSPYPGDEPRRRQQRLHPYALHRLELAVPGHVLNYLQAACIHVHTCMSVRLNRRCVHMHVFA